MNPRAQRPQPTARLTVGSSDAWYMLLEIANPALQRLEALLRSQTPALSYRDAPDRTPKLRPFINIL